jgi:hypothetical protein
MMIEIVISSATGIGIALGILDGHIRAIQRSKNIPHPEGSVREAVGKYIGSDQIVRVVHSCRRL